MLFYKKNVKFDYTSFQYHSKDRLALFELEDCLEFPLFSLHYFFVMYLKDDNMLKTFRHLFRNVSKI